MRADDFWEQCGLVDELLSFVSAAIHTIEADMPMLSEVYQVGVAQAGLLTLVVCQRVCRMQCSL